VSSNDDNRDLLAVAVEAIQSAGRVIAGRPAQNIIDKGDRDPRTGADLDAEHCIRAHLAEQTPEVPVLGEEEGGPSAETGLVWVVDPIDGTVNYLHGIPTFAISVSLIENGRTVLGATHLPALDTTYTVLAGFGARADNAPIRASRVTSLRDAVVAIDQFTFSGLHPAQSNETRLALVEHLAPLVQRLRIHGASTVDLAWTAHGRLDACIIVGNHPWDTSAGVLLAREAGAVVVDIEGKPHEITSRTTVAAAPGITDELLAAIEAANRATP
jgi:myo-inositol-1(or 4)-monophosphatase